MPDGYYLDPSTLETMTSGLRKASTTLGGMDLGPGAPDGGELAGEMSGLLDKLVGDTAELVAGAGAAGDHVNEARTAYLEHEHRTREGLRH
jgi:acyl CoA:acetate/3-ketoacid CoA transferase beta subunit